MLHGVVVRAQRSVRADRRRSIVDAAKAVRGRPRGADGRRHSAQRDLRGGIGARDRPDRPARAGRSTGSATTASRSSLIAAETPGRGAGRPRRWSRWTTRTCEGVFDIDEALAEAAPPVHPGGNSCITWRSAIGDVDAAHGPRRSRRSRRPIETQRVDHAYLEPESGVGWIDSDGVLTLRVSTQVIEHARQLAEILELPHSRGPRHRRVHGRWLRRQGGHDGRALPGCAGVEDPPAGADGLGAPGVAAGATEAPSVPHALPDRRRGRRNDRGAGHQDPRRRRRVPAAQLARAVRRRRSTRPGPTAAPNARMESTAVFTNTVPTSASAGSARCRSCSATSRRWIVIAERLGLDSGARCASATSSYRGDIRVTGEPIDTEPGDARVHAPGAERARRAADAHRRAGASAAALPAACSRTAGRCSSPTAHRPGSGSSRTARW